MGAAVAGSSVGEAVRGLRRRAGLTQRELAGLAGCSVGGLRDLEQGRVAWPRPATLRGLASVLGVPLSEWTAQQTTQSTLGVQVNVLGPLRVVVDGVETDLGSESQRMLLALLALSPDSPVARHTIIDALWGNEPPADAVSVLHSRVSRLRRQLRCGSGDGPDIVWTKAGYRLTIADDRLDLSVFRSGLARARRQQEAGEIAAALETYAEVLKQWRGQPVADLQALQAHPSVTELLRVRLEVAAEFGHVANKHGRYAIALPELQRVAETDELHEGIHAVLMIALAGTGQQAAALAVFVRLRRELAERFGADPGPELTIAYKRVLNQDLDVPSAAPVSAHRQLPPDIADFSGRADELRVLMDDIPSTADGATAVAIRVIEGPGGVGKTRLAIHAAHRLLAEGRHTDTQLYVDLRGHAEEPPVDPASVLESFLRLLGVPGDRIPASVSERAALYRDRLSAASALVLLDNAADEDQVLPLLPAGADSLVLVTSRRVLALDGARTLSLGMFTPDEAKEVLSRVVGAERVRAEDEDVERVVRSCGCLPLAVALVARRMQSRPQWTFAELAARLSDSDDRLAELAVGTRRLHTVFELSYRALPEAERRLFRLLSLHPGEDFTVDSAGALAGLSPAASRRALDRLADENLITSVTGYRYRQHDLLRDYARHRALQDESEQERHTVIRRVVDFYLHTTVRAIRAVQPRRVRFHHTGTPPQHAPAFDTVAQAEEWLRSERASLLAAVIQASEAGLSTHSWQLASAMWSFHLVNSYYDDMELAHRTGLAAAETAGDPLGRSIMLTWLGSALTVADRTSEAEGFLWKALSSEPEPYVAVSALFLLGLIRYREGNITGAVHHARRARHVARRLYPALGRNDIDTAFVENAYRDFEHAFGEYQQSRLTADPERVCRAMADLADASRRLSLLDGAEDWLDHASKLALELGSTALARYVAGYRRLLLEDRR